MGETKKVGENAINGLAEEIQLFKPAPPHYYGCGEWMFLIAQGICMLCFAFFTRYGEGVHPDSTTSSSDARDLVQNLYPFFQDVHVMIFIGFGFLMTFIKTSQWSALCFNWIISIWALQWSILFGGFWH
jgi:hypothetical protein